MLRDYFFVAKFCRSISFFAINLKFCKTTEKKRLYLSSAIKIWRLISDTIFLLLQCIQKAAVENEHLVLVLEDWQLVDSHFLEYVNSLLACGEVAGLYTPEELEAILSPLREKASEEGYQVNQSSLIPFFQGKMRNFFIHYFPHTRRIMWNFFKKCHKSVADCMNLWRHQNCVNLNVLGDVTRYFSKIHKVKILCRVGEFFPTPIYLSYLHWPYYSTMSIVILFRKSVILPQVIKSNRFRK